MLYGVLERFSLNKAMILCNAFIDSQCNYAPLIWMFLRKTFYSQIERKFTIDFKSDLWYR